MLTTTQTEMLKHSALYVALNFQEVLKEGQDIFEAQMREASPEPWPVCISCGREHDCTMFDETIPETSCSYCEKRFWCR